MAVKDFFDNLNGGARWDVGVSINRSNSLPLDANSVFASLEDAQNYAKGTPAEGTLANAYPGQVLAVVTDAETIIYYIDANMTLQPVGNTKDVMAYIGDIPETSDAKTIVEYINSKTEGIATTESLAQLQKDVQALADTVNGKEASGEEGTEDYVPAVVGLVEEVANIKTTIGTEAEGTEGEEGYKAATGLEKKIADNAKAISGKVDKVDGKGLSTNDLTDSLKANYDAAYEHSQTDHAPADAEKNVIVGVQVNGADIAVDGNRKVNVVIPDAAEYSIVKAENSGDYAAVYNLTKDGTIVGSSINIPKDMVVESGSVVENPEGQTEGTYIELKLQNVAEPLYINVGDLIEYVTSGSTADDMVVINVSDDHKVTATITNGTITLDKLHSDVKNEINKAHIHDNKTILDSITEANITDWNDAVAKEHEHANKTLLDTYTQTEENLADAVAKKHAHTNATVLDGITAEKVATWDIAEKNVIASVDENQFAIDENRKLTLGDIAQDKITGLTNAAGNEATLAELLASKVDKVEGSRLINAEEIAKLAGLVVDPETGETSLPISGQISMSQVDGLAAALDGKVEKVEGMGLSANNFTNTLLDKLNGIAAGAQVNVIEGIKFNGATVTVGEDKVADITYALPIADVDTIGGVKSVEAIIGDDGKITNAAEIENKICVAEDGTMEVNSVNVNKLVQTSGEYLIMNGGSASV